MVAIRDEPSGAGATCRAILDTLPTWFGIEEANVEYVRIADEQPTIIASDGDDDVGIAVITLHSDAAAEVHLLAVKPAYHRHGVGRQLLRHAEAGLAARGVQFLQVKTLSPSHPDEGYKSTRAFYEEYGFVALEEFPTLWNPENPALQMIKTVP